MIVVYVGCVRGEVLERCGVELLIGCVVGWYVDVVIYVVEEEVVVECDGGFIFECEDDVVVCVVDFVEDVFFFGVDVLVGR